MASHITAIYSWQRRQWRTTTIRCGKYGQWCMWFENSTNHNEIANRVVKTHCNKRHLVAKFNNGGSAESRPRKGNGKIFQDPQTEEENLENVKGEVPKSTVQTFEGWKEKIREQCWRVCWRVGGQPVWFGHSCKLWTGPSIHNNNWRHTKLASKKSC